MYSSTEYLHKYEYMCVGGVDESDEDELEEEGNYVQKNVFITSHFHTIFD